MAFESEEPILEPHKVIAVSKNQNYRVIEYRNTLYLQQIIDRNDIKIYATSDHSASFEKGRWVVVQDLTCDHRIRNYEPADTYRLAQGMLEKYNK